MPENPLQLRNCRTIKEASELTGMSPRSVRRWTSLSRAQWLEQKTKQREEIRAYHDEGGHSWTETDEHFGISAVTARLRAYHAREE